MEELQTIVDMVAKLPHTALWVLAGFWAYKVVVIGSIYGVIRFVVEKLHSWATTPKHELLQVRPMLDKLCITGEVTYLIEQIMRVAGKGVSIDSPYLHHSCIDWLREAIDEKMAREKTRA